MKMNTFRNVIALFITFFLSPFSFGQCEDFDLSATVNDLLCYGDTDGSFELDVVGSTGDITYTISPEIYSISDEGVASDLPGGTYHYTVEDEAGCFLEGDITISEPSSMYFSELGFDPAFCRTANDDTGNGVVYAAASGGTPNFHYLWTNLETGETNTNSTWGGLNPGTYRIECVDENGCLLSGELQLDSLNPIANFDIISDDIWEIPYGYAGMAPVEIYCRNRSENLINHYDPDSDTAKFYWQMHNYAEWIETDFFYEPSITYEFENLWGIKLVMESKNGCLDTAHQFIAVFGPVTVEEESHQKMVNLIPNHANNQLKILSVGFNQGVQVRLYSITGALLLEEEVFDQEKILDFQLSFGTYLYEFIDLENQAKIGSGKFVY